MLSEKQIEEYMNINGRQDSYVENNIKIAAAAVDEMDMWEYIKEKQSTGGFMFCDDTKFYELVDLYIKKGGDDWGTIIGFTFRYIQAMANHFFVDSSFKKCAICLEEDCSEKVLLDCGHSFHTSCVIEWNNSINERHPNVTGCNKNCPLCRGNTVPYYLKTSSVL